MTYTTFKYRRSEFDDANALSERMERDLVAFVKEHLAELQSFDTVAIYYDGGQNAVRSAIRNAFDETLSVNTAEYKSLRYQDRRLAQAADYFCSIELAALRYADHDAFAGARQISSELCAPGAHSHDAGTWALRLAGLGDLVPEAGVRLQPLSAAFE